MDVAGVNVVVQGVGLSCLLAAEGKTSNSWAVGVEAVRCISDYSL